MGILISSVSRPSVRHRRRSTWAGRSRRWVRCHIPDEGQRNLPFGDQLVDLTVFVIEVTIGPGAANTLTIAGGRNALLNAGKTLDALFAALVTGLK